MMPQPPDEDFTQLDAFLGNTMAGILDTLEKFFDPSKRLMALSRRTGQQD